MRLTTLLLLSLTTLPSVALAESAAPSCAPGTVQPSGIDIPANLSAFVLSGGIYRAGTLPSLRLVEHVGAGEEERGLDVAIDESYPSERWILTPTEPLVEGSTYDIIDDSCDFSPRTTTLQVVAAMPAPATLGVTTVSELRASRTSPARELRYYVVTSLVLSDEARAARALYEGQRLVDGVSPEPWWFVLSDIDQQLEVDCGGGEGVAPGARSVRHQARALGLEPTLFTDAVEVSIACEDAVRVHPLDEHPLTPEEIAMMDQMDGGVAAVDAGRLDAGPNSGMSGGGCSVSPRTGFGAAAWFALAALGVFLRRR